MDPRIIDVLRGLGRIGARATAAAVDTALDEAEEFVAEIADRIRTGRATAQSIGKKPPRKVVVDVQPVDNDEDDG